MRYLLFDVNENFISTLSQIVSAKITEEIDAEDVFEAVVLDHIEKGDRVLLFDEKLNFFREYNIEGVVETETEHGVEYNIYGENSWYETLGDYLNNTQIIGRNLNVALEKIMEYSRWGVGKVEESDKLGTLYLYHTSVNIGIHDLLLEWDMELETDVRYNSDTQRITRKINILKKRGENRGNRISYTREIKGIKRETLRQDTITAIYAYGAGVAATKTKDSAAVITRTSSKTPQGATTATVRTIMTKRVDLSSVNGGKLYIEDLNALNRYGRIGKDGNKMNFSKVMIYEDITDPSKLLEAARLDLKLLCAPQTSYDVSILDLYSTLGLEQDRFELGDDVQVIDRAFNPPITLTTRILRITRDLLNEENTEAVLGQLVRDFTDLQGDNRVMEVPDDLAEFVEDDGLMQDFKSVDELLKEFPSLKLGLDSWADMNDENTVVMNAGGDVVMVNDTITGEMIYEQKNFDRRPSVKIMDGRRWISFNPEMVQYNVRKYDGQIINRATQAGEYLDYMKPESQNQTVIVVYVNRTPKPIGEPVLYGQGSGSEETGYKAYQFYATGEAHPMGYSVRGIRQSEIIKYGAGSIRQITVLNSLYESRDIPDYTIKQFAAINYADYRNINNIGMNKVNYDDHYEFREDAQIYEFNGFFAGEVAEVIIYHRQIAGFEVQALKKYIEDKYAAGVIAPPPPAALEPSTETVSETRTATLENGTLVQTTIETTIETTTTAVTTTEIKTVIKTPLTGSKTKTTTTTITVKTGDNTTTDKTETTVEI